MKPNTIYKYFALGHNYYLLRRDAADTPVHGVGGMVRVLEHFFGALDELRLDVTRAAAKSSGELYEILTRIQAMPSDAVVDDTLGEEIEAAIDALDVTLDAELGLRQVYVVTPKRYNTDQLLKQPLTLLADQTPKVLPPLVSTDFSSACACTAYEQPTAAAFHLMRAVEAALRWYYCKLVKRNRVEPLLWGQMILQLSKRRDPPPKPLLDHLDNIRANFRNPTQHPDAVYTMDEAQDLLHVAIDVLNRMVRAIEAGA